MDVWIIPIFRTMTILTDGTVGQKLDGDKVTEQGNSASLNRMVHPPSFRAHSPRKYPNSREQEGWLLVLVSRTDSVGYYNGFYCRNRSGERWRLVFDLERMRIVYGPSRRQHRFVTCLGLPKPMNPKNTGVAATYRACLVEVQLSSMASAGGDGRVWTELFQSEAA